MQLHMHDAISYPHPHPRCGRGSTWRGDARTVEKGWASERGERVLHRARNGRRLCGRRGGGWLRFPPRCVITRHYPPIKSLSNNYLTVAVTHSRPLRAAALFILTPFHPPPSPSLFPRNREPGLPAIKASPFLNHYWMTALATTVQGWSSKFHIHWSARTKMWHDTNAWLISVGLIMCDRPFGPVHFTGVRLITSRTLFLPRHLGISRFWVFNARTLLSGDACYRSKIGENFYFYTQKSLSHP